MTSGKPENLFVRRRSRERGSELLHVAQVNGALVDNQLCQIDERPSKRKGPERVLNLRILSVESRKAFNLLRQRRNARGGAPGALFLLHLLDSG